MKRFLTMLAVAMGAMTCAGAFAEEPVLTDSRIKTFVYNENRVYTVMTEAGYQSNIEFGPGEEIETLSVGDRIGWQIVPSGRRLFLRALEDNVRTNMTVVTSKRTYQFDLSSIAPKESKRPDVVYVARFYYPTEEDLRSARAVAANDLLSTAEPEAEMHYDYTYTGPDTSAPLKIFDNGKETYFKFRGQGPAPALALVRPDGMETPVPLRASGEYLVAPVVGARFTIRRGQDVICVFNESLSQASR